MKLSETLKNNKWKIYSKGIETTINLGFQECNIYTNYYVSETDETHQLYMKDIITKFEELENKLEKAEKENEELKKRYDFLEKRYEKTYSENIDLFDNKKDVYEKLKQKADKYDNLHEFSKSIDELIKGEIRSKCLNIPNRKIKKFTDNSLGIISTSSENTNNIYSICFENSYIEKQKPYFFDFDYDLLEKLYDKGCILKSSDLKNKTSIYENGNGFNNFGEEAINLQEYKMKWSAHKDNKQLTKEEIEELIK